MALEMRDSFILEMIHVLFLGKWIMETHALHREKDHKQTNYQSNNITM